MIAVKDLRIFVLRNKLEKQRQSAEMICKKKNVFKFHRKTPVLESLFNKETPTQLFSWEICEVFQKNYRQEHVRTTAFKTSTSSKSKHEALD